MNTEHEQNHGEWLNFSLKSIAFILVALVLFVWYVSALLFGENSLSVLNKLEDEKDRLVQESKTLKNANQKLQKEYFELIQLNGD